MSMIRVENLSKSVGGLPVLENVSLTVEAGERIALIGRSGCGKTLFLRCLELLEKPEEGRIFIGEEEITSKGAKVDQIRASMGMVDQGLPLFAHLDVLENITLAPMQLRKVPRQVAEEKAKELLRLVGLENKCYAMPETLTGGQQRRIAICRSLAMEPKVMLFDEPTSALEPAMVGEVLATLRMLAKQGRTMLIVTHEIALAKELATRVLYFDEQGIYEDGTPSAVFDRPKHAKTKAFLQNLKFFSQHIDTRQVDLMQLQGGIRLFAERYGVGSKEENNVQLCAEELIYGLLGGALEPQEHVNMDVFVAYRESDKTVSLRVRCAGREYDPFGPPEGAQAHLSVRPVKHPGKKITREYIAGRNEILIEF